MLELKQEGIDTLQIDNVKLEIINEPTIGPRSESLYLKEPSLKRLNPIQILQYVPENSSSSENLHKHETGIVLFPGGLGRGIDSKTIHYGAERGMTVIQIRYPNDSSFSIRSEVARTLDHAENLGIKNYIFITGSWGGIPVMRSIYSLLDEGKYTVESFMSVASALQPSDFKGSLNIVRKTIALASMSIKAPFPGRQIMSRISGGISDDIFENPETLSKLSKIPTTFLVPYKGSDWWVNAQDSYKKYFPQSIVVGYPGYSNILQEILTLGGHDCRYAEPGIREIEKQILDNPNIKPKLPENFRLLRN